MSQERPRGGLYQYQSTVLTHVNPGAPLPDGQYPDSWHPDTTRVVVRFPLAIPTGVNVFETPAPPVVPDFGWFVETVQPRFRRRQITRFYVYEPVRFEPPTTGWHTLPSGVVTADTRPITYGVLIVEPSVFTTQDHSWLAMTPPSPVRREYRVPLPGVNLYVPPILPPFEWYVPIVQRYPYRRLKARESWIYEPITPSTVFTGWMHIPYLPVIRDRRPITPGCYTAEPTNFVTPVTGWLSQHPIRPLLNLRPPTFGVNIYEPTNFQTPITGWLSMLHLPAQRPYRQPWPGITHIEPSTIVTPITSWMTLAVNPPTIDRRPVTVGQITFEQLLTQHPIVGWLAMTPPRPPTDRRPITAGDWRYEPTLFDAPVTGWLSLVGVPSVADRRHPTVGMVLYEPSIFETPDVGWFSLPPVPIQPLRPPLTHGAHTIEPSGLVELTPMGWLYIPADVVRREHRLLIPGIIHIEPSLATTPNVGWLTMPPPLVGVHHNRVAMGGMISVFVRRPYDYRRWRSG